jgi:MGT family glycosyltransferase
MSTAYVFSLPYYGHINPCLPLMQELARRGEHVVFYGMEAFRASAEASGATFRSFEFEETEKNIALTTMAEWQMRIVEQTLDGLIDDARAEKPAYILSDYTCLWGRFLAQHLRLRAAVIHTTYPLTQSRLSLARIVWRDLRRAPNVRLKLISYLRADRRVSRRWGVPRVGLPSDLLRADYGDLHLVLTSRDLAIEARKLDERYCFVGPCIRNAGLSSGDPLPALDSRPLIYLSLGTHWRHPQTIYRACIEAFGNRDVQVVVTGNDRIEPEVRAALPANFHVLAYVDQVEILRRAAVFITHGGMNSVCESLVAGVPMIVYPQGFDQFNQARFVEKTGTGRAITHDDITAGHIRSLVDALLQDEGVRERCLQTGRKLCEGGGAARAADLMMALKRHPAHEAAGTGGEQPASPLPT